MRENEFDKVVPNIVDTPFNICSFRLTYCPKIWGEINHKHGHKTNAIVESANAKIKEAIRQNKGTRDLDFFHFRIAIVI